MLPFTLFDQSFGFLWSRAFVAFRLIPVLLVMALPFPLKAGFALSAWQADCASLLGHTWLLLSRG